tara:strand:+ start:1847 stop:2710 length:864 start_codon:yes stop_codon:yes gene_type:complete
MKGSAKFKGLIKTQKKNLKKTSQKMKKKQSKFKAQLKAKQKTLASTAKHTNLKGKVETQKSKVKKLLSSFTNKTKKVNGKLHSNVAIQINNTGAIKTKVGVASSAEPLMNDGNEFSEEVNLFLETQQCSIFTKLNLQRKSRKTLKNTYLKKKDGLTDYYNKYLDCLDKTLETDENRLLMLEDPKFNDGLSPNQKKLNEMKLRRNLRKNKKILRKICTRTERVFCEKTENPKEQLKRGIDVCQKRNMCMGLNVSLGNIPRDASMFMSNITKTFLGPLIKTVSKPKVVN